MPVMVFPERGMLMANRIKMDKVSAILCLHKKGWSYSEIARELGVHRYTVSRYVKLARSGSKSTSNPTPGNIQNSQNPTPGIFGPESTCEPFREEIETKLELGLSGKRIWQDLKAEHGFTASYSSVKRYIKRLGKSTPLPFRRIETEPGKEAQVDFGTGPLIRCRDGRRRRTHIFRIILSSSRRAYSEAVFRQDTESFIRAIENAFRHFGGVTETLVIDNLKAAVTRADWYDTELNPKIVSFSEHYGTVILPTKPYTPRHKGKVENSVKYVKANALKGREFKSISELNDYLLDWEKNVADCRIHGTTRRQVRKMFDEIEKSTLGRLPVETFPFYHEGERSVHRDGHVEIDRSYYSVPPEYVGLKVWVRWDSRLVRIFNRRFEQIAVHTKREPGRFSTDGGHISKKKISKVEKGAAWNLRQCSLIGPNAAKWAAALIKTRGVQGIRALIGLQSMRKKYADAELEHACGLAHSHGAYRLKHIRALVGRNEKQETFEFTEEHPIIRDLADYGRVIKVDFKSEGAKLSKGRKLWNYTAR